MHFPELYRKSLAVFVLSRESTSYSKPTIIVTNQEASSFSFNERNIMLDILIAMDVVGERSEVKMH
jgi:hypothetical protein